jgi:hypothetical protein
MQQLATACRAEAQAVDWGVWLLGRWILWEGQAWVEVWAVWAAEWVEWVAQVLWAWVDQAPLVLLQVVWGLLAVLVAAYWRGGRLLHLQQALLLLLREHW